MWLPDILIVLALLAIAVGWLAVLLATDTPRRLTIGQKTIAIIGGVVLACGLVGLACVTPWWLFLMWVPIFAVTPIPEYLSGGRGCG